MHHLNQLKEMYRNVLLGNSSYGSLNFTATHPTYPCHHNARETFRQIQIVYSCGFAALSAPGSILPRVSRFARKATNPSRGHIPSGNHHEMHRQPQSGPLFAFQGQWE